MSSEQLNIDFAELKAAIDEIGARSKDVKIGVRLNGRKLILTANDNGDNLITVTLYDNNNLGAQISLTHRLMYLKGENKKRL